MTVYCNGTDPDSAQVYADSMQSILSFKHMSEYDSEHDCIRLQREHPKNLINADAFVKALAMDFDAIKADLDSR